MTVLLFICWGLIGYFACRIAYIQGRRDKWEDVSRQYICIHKSCCVVPNIQQSKKDLTNKHKIGKIYRRKK